MDLTDLASIATLVGVPIAVAALLFSAGEARRSRQTVTATFLLDLEAKTGERLATLAASSRDNRQVALANLLNVIEAGCAVRSDRLLSGRSRTIFEDKILGILKAVDETEQARTSVDDMITASDTYTHIAGFIRDMKQQGRY